MSHGIPIVVLVSTAIAIIITKILDHMLRADYARMKILARAAASAEQHAPRFSAPEENDSMNRSELNSVEADRIRDSAANSATTEGGSSDTDYGDEDGDADEDDDEDSVFFHHRQLKLAKNHSKHEFDEQHIYDIEDMPIAFG